MQKKYPPPPKIINAFLQGIQFGLLNLNKTMLSLSISNNIIIQNMLCSNTEYVLKHNGLCISERISDDVHYYVPDYCRTATWRTYLCNFKDTSSTSHPFQFQDTGKQNLCLKFFSSPFYLFPQIMNKNCQNDKSTFSFSCLY